MDEKNLFNDSHVSDNDSNIELPRDVNNKDATMGEEFQNVSDNIDFSQKSDVSESEESGNFIHEVIADESPKTTELSENVNSISVTENKDIDDFSNGPKKKTPKKLIIACSVGAVIIAAVVIVVAFAGDIFRVIQPKAYLAIVLANVAGDWSENSTDDFLAAPFNILNGDYIQDVTISPNSIKFNGEDFSSIAKNINLISNGTVDNVNKKISNTVTVKFLNTDIMSANTYLSMDEWALNIPEINEDYILINPKSFVNDWNNSVFAGAFNAKLPESAMNIDYSELFFKDVQTKKYEDIKQEIIEFLVSYADYGNIKYEGKASVSSPSSYGDIKCGKITVTFSKDDLPEFIPQLYNILKHYFSDNAELDTLFESRYFSDDLVVSFYTNKYKLIKCDINTIISGTSQPTVDALVDISIILEGTKNSTDELSSDCSISAANEKILDFNFKMSTENTEAFIDKNATFTIVSNNGDDIAGKAGLKYDKSNETNGIKGNINFQGVNNIELSFNGIVESGKDNNSFILNLDNCSFKSNSLNELSTKLNYSINATSDTNNINYPANKAVNLFEQDQMEQLMYYISIDRKIEMLLESLGLPPLIG